MNHSLRSTFALLLLLLAGHSYSLSEKAVVPNYVVSANENTRLYLDNWLLEQFKNSTVQTESQLIKNKQWKTRSKTSDKPSNIIDEFYHFFTIQMGKLFSTSSNKSKSTRVIDELNLKVVITSDQSLQNLTKLKLKIRALVYKKYNQLGYKINFINIDLTQKNRQISSTEISNNSDNFLTINSESTKVEDSLHSSIIQWVLLLIVVIATIIAWRVIVIPSQKRQNSHDNNSLPDDLESLFFGDNSDQNDSSSDNPDLTKQVNNQQSSNKKNSHNETSTKPEKPLTQEPSSKPKKIVNKETLQLEGKLRRLLISSMAKHPFFIRKMYGLWQKDQGTTNDKNTLNPYLGRKVAVVYDLLGKEILKSAIPQIHEENFVNIAYIAQNFKADLEIWRTSVQLVGRNTQSLVKQLENEDPYQNPFGFINAMPDQAVINLIKNKAFHIQSIVMSQFDTVRCRAILLKISAPNDIQRYEQEIEHYQQFNSYFFQDVSNYLAYVLSSMLFKNETVPLNKVMEQFPNNSQKETQRALNDITRQMNLGLQSHQAVKKSVVETEKSITENNNSTKTTIEKQEPNQVLSKTNPNTNWNDEWFDFSNHKD